MSVQVDRRHSEDSQIWLIFWAAFHHTLQIVLWDCILTEAAGLIMGPHSNTHCRCYYGTTFQHRLHTLWDCILKHALIYRCCNEAGMPSYHVMVRPHFAAGADSL